MQYGKKFWIALVAFQFVYGVAVFGIARQMYSSDSVPPMTAPQPTGEQSQESPQQEFDVNPQMLESLLGPSIDATDAQTVSLLANEYFADKNYAKAAEMYERLLTLDPDNADVINNLGLTLHYVGRSSEAVDILNRGAILAPNNQRLHLTIGFVNRDLGNSEVARSALEAAVRLDPESAVGKSAAKMLAEV